MEPLLWSSVACWTVGRDHSFARLQQHWAVVDVSGSGFYVVNHRGEASIEIAGDDRAEATPSSKTVEAVSECDDNHL